MAVKTICCFWVYVTVVSDFPNENAAIEFVRNVVIVRMPAKCVYENVILVSMSVEY